MFENLLANAADKGSVPDLERFPHAVKQLSPCATTLEPVYSLRATTADPELLEPVVHRKRIYLSEKPVHCSKE